ncbi:MAG: hypothetical protein KJ645_05380 [Planctomycetes bacterium]|nr:hypothetical protein [Planctomycetota bacterium]
MKKENADTLRMIPPPGPMVWLFPDLASLGMENRTPDRSVSLLEPVLDLQKEGLSGQELLDWIRTRAPGRIEIDQGPRGHTLWTWLSQALRGQGIVLPRPSPLPLVGRFPLPKKGFGSISLETLLTGAALFREEAGTETVIVPMGDPKKEWFEPATFSPQTARAVLSRRAQGETPAWLVPLNHDTTLEAELTRFLEIVGRSPELFQNAHLIPFFNTKSGAPVFTGKNQMADGFSTRLLPSWWGLLPGDVWPRSLRREFLNLFRLLHPEKVFFFRALENYALAGIDSYFEALMNRFSAPVKPARDATPKPLILGICGTDGSGKSSHVAALKEYLQSKGLKVCVHKIYRHGVFHKTVTDLTRQCAKDQHLHLWRLQRIIKAFDSIKYFYNGLEEALGGHDVVIFDRYVFTHYAAGVGRYHHDPFARELLEPFPEADRVYLLDVPTDEAMRRIGTRDERTVDENAYMLARYRHSLNDLADRYGFVVLNALNPFEENRETIVDDVEKLLRRQKPRGGGS